MPERMDWYTSTETDENGCRLWLGGKNKSGYPTVSVGRSGKSTMAHRVAYELAGGTLDYKPIHHKCGNKMCVEPTHLVAVEPHENTAEMLERKWYQQRIAELEAELANIKVQ